MNINQGIGAENDAAVYRARAMALFLEYSSRALKDSFLNMRKDIPKDRLYEETLKIYYQVGFDFPKEAIMDIKKLRPENYLDELPDKYKSCDVIPVIRATTTPIQSIEQVADEISWTMFYDCAKYFHGGKNHLRNSSYYAGIIKKDDIIAIKSDPCLEIVQVGSVKDITVIPPSFVDSHLGREISFDDFNQIKEQYGNLTLTLAKLMKPANSKESPSNAVES